jgi:hypothetical protein
VAASISFVLSQRAAQIRLPCHAGIGDFDHNAHDDILWQDTNGAVTIWDNGRPSGAHTLIAAGAFPSGWHIA